MKARLETVLPGGDGWSFEVKLDGIRALVVKDGARVQLCSRLPREITTDYPHIVEALRRLPAKQLVGDGEIVALDETGRPSFQLLQNRNRHPSRAAQYYLFDLLQFDGLDLKPAPLAERRKLLEALLKGVSDPLRLSALLKAPASHVWRKVRRLGLEGVIAKRNDSVYEPGRRSGAWLKLKTQTEQEFVIGGYSPPEGTRKFFGAVLVGYYRGSQLLFASKVGTGFAFAALRSLHHLFHKHRVARCPFANLPARKPGRGLTGAELARCAWLRPKLVCQVRFMEWTNEGGLRQPVFLGLREEKAAGDVVRETDA